MPKTNLEIIDQDLWNWVKYKKNELKLKSTGDFVFKVLEMYKNEELEQKTFLINIEKYFEYNYFNMKDLSNSMNSNLDYTIKLINKYIGKNVPLFGTEKNEDREKALKKIHELMIENHIIPRELSIAYKIKKYLDNNQIDLADLKEYIKNNDENKINFDNKLVLNIVYPDIEERRREIYHQTIQIANWFVNNKNSYGRCLNCEDEKCPIKNPDFIYFKSGLDTSKDDLENDLIADILKSHYNKDFLIYYGFSLLFSIDLIIRKQLSMVHTFISEKIYTFEKPELINVFISLIFNISKENVISAVEKDKEWMSNLYNRISEDNISTDSLI